MRVAMRMIAGATPLVLAAGCDLNTPVYFAPEAPVTSNPDEAYGARATVAVVYRRPTPGERDNLRMASEARGVPIPWVRLRDVALSIQYTITNLSDRAGTAFLHVDGATQYTRYDAAMIRQAFVQAAMNENNVPYVPSLIQSVPIPVPARASVSGVVREDEIAEAALDLDAIGRWMAPYQVVLYHHSSRSRLGLEMVPAQVELPQFIELTVSLEADRPMRLEFLVRARDARGILAESGDERFSPNPMNFIPAAAMPMMPAMMMPAAAEDAAAMPGATPDAGQ